MGNEAKYLRVVVGLTIAMTLTTAARAAPRIFRIVTRPPVWVGQEIWRTNRDLATSRRDWAWEGRLYTLAAAADLASTAYVSSRCATCSEIGPIGHGSHGWVGVDLGTMLWDAAVLVASHRLDRTKLWMLGDAGLGIGGGAHASSAYHNAGICTSPRNLCK